MVTVANSTSVLVTPPGVTILPPPLHDTVITHQSPGELQSNGENLGAWAQRPSRPSLLKFQQVSQLHVCHGRRSQLADSELEEPSVVGCDLDFCRKGLPFAERFRDNPVFLFISRMNVPRRFSLIVVTAYTTPVVFELVLCNSAASERVVIYVLWGWETESPGGISRRWVS